MMFGKSWTMFRIRGIPIKLHVSLAFFLPYVAFVSSLQYRSIARSLDIDPATSALPPLAWGIVLAIGLFVAILLHELGHCLVALESGVRVRSITLMMLGGVSSMERDVSTSREAWMAFAGPLVSFLIAFASYAIYRWLNVLPDVDVALLAFSITNGVVGAFNLLPAFPMDGGRILRGLLSGHFGLVRATNIATRTGQVMAILFGVWGFLNFNVILILIAAFVYMGASGERARLNTRDVLHGFPVSQFMNDRLGDAWAGESAGVVARRLLANNWVGARVAPAPLHPGPDGPNLGIPSMGIITAWDLTPDGRDGETDHSIQSRVRTDLPKVRSDEDASRALELFLGGQVNTVLVVDDQQRVVGLLTPTEVKRALVLADAMMRGNAPRSA
jgi:Zn-dependent protease